MLILSLQLLARTLSSLQRSQRSAAGHVSWLSAETRPIDTQGISFLNAHREAILSLLRQNQQFVSLMGIEELKLLVSIIGMVVHKVPADDLVSIRPNRSSI